MVEDVKRISTKNGMVKCGLEKIRPFSPPVTDVQVKMMT